MPGRDVRTVRDLIYYQCAKIAARSAFSVSDGTANVPTGGVASQRGIGLKGFTAAAAAGGTGISAVFSTIARVT